MVNGLIDGPALVLRAPLATVDRERSEDVDSPSSQATRCRTSCEYCRCVVFAATHDAAACAPGAASRDCGSPATIAYSNNPNTAQDANICSCVASNLTLEGEGAAPLPGYRDEANVRRFDAPEALETRFYERPRPLGAEQSGLRSLEDACSAGHQSVQGAVMCVSYWRRSRDRAILLGSTVRTTRWPHLEAATGCTARFATAYIALHSHRVLDKWSSIKPRMRSTLEDGNELIVERGAPLFLRGAAGTVIGAECGPLQRPFI